MRVLGPFETLPKNQDRKTNVELSKVKECCFPYIRFCRIALQFALLDWNRKLLLCHVACVFAWLTAFEFASYFV